MNIHSLHEQRAAKVAELRTINDIAMNAGRDLDDSERAKFASIETETRSIQSQIDRAEQIARLEKMEAATETSSGFRDLSDLERRFSIGKALAEFSEGKLSGAEAEYAREFRSGRQGAFSAPVSAFLGGSETRALTTTLPAGGPGGALVGNDLGPLVDRLRPNLAIETLGATVLRGLTGNLDLPRIKSSGTATWVAEHAPATGSDMQFDKVPLGPKTVAAQYEISRRMILQAAQIEQILRADIGFLLAQALDAAAINGSGANSPQGIMTVAGVPVVILGTNGAAPINGDPFADLQGAVLDANSSGTGFLTNTKVRKLASKIKDGQLRPFGLAEVFQNEPVHFSNQVPSNLTKGTGTNLSAAIYGNWSDLVLGYWSSIDILMNPYADSVASKGGALVHAFLDADVAIRHPESFAVCKDIITA